MDARTRILVTGGAGFIGAHLVRLASLGSHVVVLDNLSGGGAPALPKGVDFVCGDFGDRGLVARTIHSHKITAIVHFAGKICVGESVQRPELYFDINVAKTLALLDVVLHEGPPVFVFSSSAAAHEPTNPYGVTKLTIEHALRAYGRAHSLQWAAMRYFNAAGAHPDGTLREAHNPETHLIPLAIDAALGKRPPLTIYGDKHPTLDGTCVRDYVHVMDLARAHLAAIDALDEGIDVGVVNLGSETGTSVRSVIATTERVLGKPVPFVVGAPRAGDPPSLVASCHAARELLGWKPNPDLATMIEDAARSRMIR